MSDPHPPGSRPADRIDPEMDPEVAGALALRAVGRAVAALAGTTVVIGLVATGAAMMAQVQDGGAGARVTLPGLTVLMWAEAVTLLATGAAALVLFRLIRRAVPDPRQAMAGLSRALGLGARVLLAGCVLAIAVWAILEPGLLISAIVGAAVAAQVAVVLGAIRANLGTRPPAAR